MIKAKQTEAEKASDTALVAVDALNVQLLTIKQSFVDRQTAPHRENQSSRDTEFAKESAAHRDRMRKAISDLLQLMSEMKGQYGSSKVISQVANNREHAVMLLDFINKKDRPALTAQLQKNVAVTNVSIVDVRSDAGATLKFSVGPIVNCLSVKTTCDGKTHTVTLNPNLILPESELGRALDLAVSKVKIVEELLKDLAEEIRNKRTTATESFRKFDEANQQAMNALSSLVKALNETRSTIRVSL
jgi:hypothetical protein